MTYNPIEKDGDGTLEVDTLGDAGALGGYDSSDLARLAEEGTVSGNWIFQERATRDGGEIL